MRLAVSNIAWAPGDDGHAIDVLGAAGIDALEVAPGMIWSDPAVVSEADARRWADAWRSRNIEIVACQSLLFGQPQLAVFAPPRIRAATLDHLRVMIRLGAWVGARVLTFGSPMHRRASGLSAQDRDRIALDFFRTLGDAAVAANVVVCIEPSPEAYGCDWLRSVSEAGAFVELVAHPGIGLQLDAGGIALGGDDVRDIAAALRTPGVRHVHASEPFLAPLGTVESTRRIHRTLASALHESGYDGVVSLEMRRQDDIDVREALRHSVQHLGEWYAARA